MKSGNSEELVRLNRRGLGTGYSSGHIFAAVALLTLTGTIILGFGPSIRQVPAANHPAAPPPIFAFDKSTRGKPQFRTAYSHLPLIFEANQGQSDPRVKFLARGNKYGLFLTADEAVLEFKHSGLSTQSSNAVSVIRMHFAGTGSSGSVSGVDELPGKSNYLIGNDPAKWHRNVPQFSRVRYQNVYPGIDLIYYGNHGRLEYDFEVAPGADPKQVSLRFHGPDK